MTTKTTQELLDLLRTGEQEFDLDSKVLKEEIPVDAYNSIKMILEEFGISSGRMRLNKRSLLYFLNSKLSDRASPEMVLQYVNENFESNKNGNCVLSNVHNLWLRKRMPGYQVSQKPLTPKQFRDVERFVAQYELNTENQNRSRGWVFVRPLFDLFKNTVKSNLSLMGFRLIIVKYLESKLVRRKIYLKASITKIRNMISKKAILEKKIKDVQNGKRRQVYKKISQKNKEGIFKISSLRSITQPQN